MTIAIFAVSLFALLVSIGSVIFAKRSAGSAKRSADEVMKTRRDTLGSHISITAERTLQERWYWDPIYDASNGLMGSPSEIRPGRTLKWPGDKRKRILLGVYVTMTNEGSLTTTVSINALRSDRCDSYDAYKKVTASPPAPATIATPPTTIANGKLLLKPGEKKGVIIRHGPSLEEWRNNGGNQPIVIGISAETSPDGSRQSWNMKLESPLLQQDPFNDSTYRVDPFQLAKIEVTPLLREYPSSARRSKKAVKNKCGPTN